KRKLYSGLLTALIWLAASFTVGLLVVMIGYILVRGVPVITWQFLSTAPSALNDTIGILPNLLNTLYVIALSLLLVLPLGVGAAVYLNEYAQSRRLVRLIEGTVETLAAIPSIIYGLVGMLFFSNFLKLQMSLLSGCLTLVIMILPTIIRTTQESLKTVPIAYREGALGLGATKWHTIRTLVVPCALDGIVTGCILAIGRIVGESAALLFTAGLAAGAVTDIFTAYKSSGGTLAVALYLYVSERGKFEVGFAIAAILLLLVLLLNGAAKLAQKKLTKKQP
ncbi:MAG: phosphate ABC transporter permease PstA, partial [Ruthenibacterium sp.]